MIKNKAKVLYHSSISIDDKIFIDPYKIQGKHSAQLILVTHSHYDHYSLEDIKKILNKDTIIVGPEDVIADVKKSLDNQTFIIRPNETLKIFDYRISAFPAYNVNKSFHKKSYNWVGYLVEYDGVRYAILGDCDENEDNRKIKCDVLLLPIGGTYTMDGKEAASLANIIKPQIVIPTHYNAIVGDKSNEREFVENLNPKLKFEIHIN